MTNDKLVANLRKRFEGYTRPAGQQGWDEMSTLVTILRPIIQLGHEPVARFRLGDPDEWVHPLQLPRGIMA
jgi:hypothetical protein